MGSGNIVAPKTLEVQLNDGGARRLTGDTGLLLGNVRVAEANAMEAQLVALINISAELAKLKALQGLTPQTTLGEEEGFALLAPYRDSAILAFKFSGKTAWERHPDGEELVQIVEGAAILNIVVDDGPPQSFEVSAGMIAIVPKGAWHRAHFPDGTTLISVTPGQTEYVQLDVDDPRTVCSLEANHGRTAALSDLS